MTTDLIERIRVRAHHPDIEVSGGMRWTENGNVRCFSTRPPATEEQIVEAEERLGFALPPLLRRLYLEVGNGGFGPGFGLLSLPTTTNSTDFQDFDAVKTYELCRKTQSASPWPAGLLTVCFWGCGIGSLLDCTKPDAPVICGDPNWTRDEAQARLPEDRITGFSDSFEVGCWLESYSFEQWLRDWVDEVTPFSLRPDPPPEGKRMTDAEVYAIREFQDEEENSPGAEYDSWMSEEDFEWVHSQS